MDRDKHVLEQLDSEGKSRKGGERDGDDHYIMERKKEHPMRQADEGFLTSSHRITKNILTVKKGRCWRARDINHRERERMRHGEEKGEGG